MQNDQGEDDRRQSAGTEPPHERDGRPTRACTNHRDGDREHSNHRQACDRVDRDTPVQIVERRQEQHSAEHEQRD